MLEHFQEDMRLIAVTPVTRSTANLEESITEGIPYNIQGAVFRLIGRDVKSAPEGEYTTEDIKIYFEPDSQKPVLNDYVINVNDGEVYHVKNLKPREEGNFVVAICKKHV